MKRRVTYKDYLKAVGRKSIPPHDRLRTTKPKDGRHRELTPRGVHQH